MYLHDMYMYMYTMNAHGTIRVYQYMFIHFHITYIELVQVISSIKKQLATYIVQSSQTHPLCRDCLNSCLELLHITISYANQVFGQAFQVVISENFHQMESFVHSIRPPSYPNPSAGYARLNKYLHVTSFL